MDSNIIKAPQWLIGSAQGVIQGGHGRRKMWGVSAKET